MLETEPSRSFHGVPAAPDTSSDVCPARVREGIGLRLCGASRGARPAPALTQHPSFPQGAAALRAVPCRARLPLPRAAPVPPPAFIPLTASDLRRATASGLPRPPCASGHFRLCEPWPEPRDRRPAQGGARAHAGGCGPATASGSAAAAGSQSLCSEGRRGWEGSRGRLLFSYYEGEAREPYAGSTVILIATTANPARSGRAKG